ncbi:DedA family protein [Aliikangiella sp. G2MR2-5]|uniref:DedA family protein n=1 Tax=Aliikangiella sp. G2MR2-5 TaxID=2788943 RepID=UPI0018AC5AAC|nr:DedA family protein [Aliikangiella sp. G2MR2-5]
MIENLLLFIEQHGEYAGIIIFIVAFLESMAIVGLLVPGWLVLVGVGSLIGADVLSFYPIVISAYFGAVIGEYISFYFGFHYHEKILAWNWVAKHQKLIEKTKEFFERWGALGVFVGRFFGPTRAVLPLAAGIAEMRKSTFMWVNFVSGIFWAPLYLIPGILIGAAFHLEKELAYQLLGILSIISFCLVWAIKSTRQYWIKHYHQQEKFEKLYKPILWWVVTLMTFAIFVLSDYLNLFVQVMSIFLSKL